MKTTSKLNVIALGVALLATGSVVASPLEIDYASTTMSFITFNGNSTFDLTPALNSFRITSGTAAGLMGEMTGVYTIGTIAGGVAPVTGNGLLTINDGATPLTAIVSWQDIYTFGTIGGLNTAGAVDLTSITYTGANPDLEALAAGSNGVNVLTFQFAPAVSLSTLKSSFNHTSYSGSITQSIPDGGTTVALLGASFLVLAGVRRKVA